MEPSALPWYRSPVYVGIVTTIVSGLLSLIGKADLFPVEMVNTAIEAVFGLIAAVALLVAERKRRKSSLQPITLTKAGADAVPAVSPK